jgi:hypothetical protein
MHTSISASMRNFMLFGAAHEFLVGHFSEVVRLTDDVRSQGQKQKSPLNDPKVG